MRYIADLHIHSPFSRATSKASHLQGLAAWAAIKGIQVVGTGDFTHPGWVQQISENLAPAEPGFFRLRPDCRTVPDNVLPPGLHADIDAIRFVLTAEISSIYKRGGQVRKVHNILFAPDLDSVRRINAVLAGIGNIESDGRPILGLDSRDLLEILLEKAPQGFLIPAHIWTPWFSLFGSKSGFDTLEECFGDLAGEVFALETGLSSDPAMNRMVSALDRCTLISNSDCHSPAKLGREANIFETGFDFHSLRQALKKPGGENGEQPFVATIEFYPEEGKYHCDGHRKCQVCMEPAETSKAGGICPVCHRPLTVGVLNRVMELADRDAPVFPPGSPGVRSLVPLTELLAEIVDTGPGSKKVGEAYVRLIRDFGSEFDVLLSVETERLAREASPVLAEAVARVRSGRVIRTPGYDGEFGVIRVFSEEERRSFGGQRGLFGPIAEAQPTTIRRTRSRRDSKKAAKSTAQRSNPLNPEQEAAVNSPSRHILVKAGPGTGKTHTLVQRVVRLAGEKARCTVITFTNRAADELRARLAALLGSDMQVFVATLHGYCLHWLRQENKALQVAGPERRASLLRSLWPDAAANELALLNSLIAEFLHAAPGDEKAVPKILIPYFSRLEQEGFIDIDGVVPAALALLQQDGQAATAMRRGTGHLLVDEFQDLNEGQYRLIQTLAQSSPVFAIGDPDQAIYGFRGSSPHWFFCFGRDMAAEQHLLFRNYRSCETVVNAAAAVIGHNQRPDGETIVNSAMSGLPGRIHLLAAESPMGEASLIQRQIEDLLGGSSHREVERLGSDGGNLGLGDIAVLYRTGRQAEILAKCLTAHGLPVQVVDLIPFYLSGPTAALYDWVLLASGQGGVDNVLAVLEREQGIGKATLARLAQSISGSGETVTPAEALAKCYPSLAGSAPEVVARLTGLHRTILEVSRHEGVGPALRQVAAYYGFTDETEDIDRLLQLAENFGFSLADLAGHLQRYSDSVVYDPRADAVTLMTLHASKGLEFKAVFIAGAEEGLLPLASRREIDGDAELEHVEEERRLWYVGMTRAREVLYLCHARTRSVDGRMADRLPSRFIGEIPPEMVSSVPGGRRGKRRKPSARQLSLFG